MENGQEFGFHWGLRGSEDLGNGLKLDFVLESGIESDTGNLDTKQGGRFFGREAQMTFSGSFGALSFGRMPSLATPARAAELMNWFSKYWPKAITLRSQSKV